MNENDDYLQIAKMIGFASQEQFTATGRAKIYENIIRHALTAETNGIQFTVTPRDTEKHKWDFSSADVGKTVTLATAEEYRDFLETLGDKKEEILNYIAQRLENYEAIKEDVRRLLNNITELDETTDHPAHIAQNVFNISIGGEEYVLRYRPAPGDVAVYLIGSSFIEGVENFEQIVAASVEDGVTIAKKIPGTQLSYLTPEIAASITNEQLNQCFDNLLIAWEKGLPMETKAKNMMYDPDAGFGFIDFNSTFTHVGNKEKRARKTDKELLDYYVQSTFFIIINCATPKDDWKPKTRQTIANNITAYTAKRDMIKRLIPIVTSKLAGKDAALAELLEAANDNINFYEEKIRDHTSEEWVKQTLAKNNESEQPNIWQNGLEVT